MISLNELQHQTIEVEVVEPPSPLYEFPQNNSLTYWVNLQDRFAQSALIDYSSSEEDYGDETKNFDATVSLVD